MSLLVFCSFLKPQWPQAGCTFLIFHLASLRIATFLKDRSAYVSTLITRGCSYICCRCLEPIAQYNTSFSSIKERRTIDSLCSAAVARVIWTYNDKVLIEKYIYGFAVVMDYLRPFQDGFGVIMISHH